MNRTLILLFWLVAFTARAQQAAYLDFDVQQPAEPNGGLKALNQFVAVNVRKPFMAQVANIKGMVILQGVVEPDGRIADVSVIRSLRPDCDREALRVFALFNAWKPAQKDGKAVRQVVTIPVPFRFNEPVAFENGVLTRYYDKNLQPVVSPNLAVLRSEVSTDSLGLPTGNLLFYKRNGDFWREEVEILFFRSQIPKRLTPAGPLFSIGHTEANEQPFDRVYFVDNKGDVYNEYHYDLNRNQILKIDRDNYGVVTNRVELVNDRYVTESWYGNGQIKQIVVTPNPRSMTKSFEFEQMLAYWDSTGNQTINEGNGQVLTKARIQSLADTNLYTVLMEQGSYEKGVKTGRWIGKRVDGSDWYEEFYDKGVFLKGRTTYVGRADTLNYTIRDRQPEFEGGIQRLGQFLVQNILYPAVAQKAGVQGKVLVSFVVIVKPNWIAKTAEKPTFGV